MLWHINLHILLADPGEARGCSTNTSVIHSFIHSLIQSWFVKISLWRRHALSVADGDFSHKIDYVTICLENLNPNGHPNRNTGSKVTTQFEIECRCGGHSVTKKFMTILQILVAKPKLWKNLYFYKEYIFNLKIKFFGWKMGRCSKPSLKMVYFRKKSLKKLDTLFGRRWFLFFFKWLVYMFEKAKRLKICKNILQKKLELGDVYKLRKKCI